MYNFLFNTSKYKHTFYSTIVSILFFVFQNSIGSSDRYNQNGRNQKPIHSKTYPENNHYNKHDKTEV